MKKEVEQGLDSKPDVVTFVDVGGRQGPELKRLREKYPNLSARLILQDLESVIKAVPEDEPFEPMVHDFFNPPTDQRHPFFPGRSSS